MLRYVSYYTLYRMDPQNTHSANVVFCLFVCFLFHNNVNTNTQSETQKRIYYHVLVVQWLGCPSVFLFMASYFI